jgi:enediyne biosynthesis protein E4
MFMSTIFRRTIIQINIIALIFLMVSALGKAQIFTRIAVGDVVSDGGSSIGCSWADFDNDGDLDLYVTNGIVGGFENNFLYENDGTGNFTRLTNSLTILDNQFSESSSWGDYNNDGWIDLFVGNSHWGGTSYKDFLFQNLPNDDFTKVTEGQIVNTQADSRSIAWCDYDNDGFIDIFIANESGVNYLYHNEQNGTFSRISEGNITSDNFSSSGCAWADYDLDGDLDLFVANQGNQNNNLYRNDGQGVFTSQTASVVANDHGRSIGCSWGDYNNDGYPDLFVANYSNQNNFLYKNNGDGTFDKVTTGDIVQDGGQTFGSSWGDYDNDGYLDLFASNLNNQKNFLYHNNGNGSFTKIENDTVVTSRGQSEGSAWADYDKDGDLDLFVVNFDGQNNFLFNNNGNSNRWINIKCKGVISNASGIGTKVQIKTSSGWQYRELSSQTGYQSQNSLNVEFGLGSTSTIDTLRIIWSSGSVDIHTNISADNFYTVTEGSEIILTALNESPSAIPLNPVLEQNYPNPFNPRTSIQYTLNNLQFVSLKVYDVLGNEVSTLVNEVKPAGSYKVKFSGTGFPSGVYFYRIEAGSFSDTKKFIIIK